MTITDTAFNLFLKQIEQWSYCLTGDILEDDTRKVTINIDLKGKMLGYPVICLVKICCHG